jgi:hypothetical protein
MAVRDTFDTVVKTMDSQRWACRIHLFQSMAPFLVRILAP